jgi:hypothetical protein
MVRDFVGRSRLPELGHPGWRAGQPSESSAKTQPNMEPAARCFGSLQPARIAAGLSGLAVAFALAGCWPLPLSNPSASPPVEISKPVSGPQTADANEAVAERFPPLDPNGRIDEETPGEAARREQGLDLLRAVRPDQMPPADTSQNGASPWPTTEPPAEPPTAAIPPEPKAPPQAPQSDGTARGTNSAEDPTSSAMKSPPQEQPPAGEPGRQPDLEQAERPKAGESRSSKPEESRPPRAARESRPAKTEENQPSTARERPAPKVRERQRSKIAHRGRREPREDQRPTIHATKNTEPPHGLRSVRNARASMEKNSIPSAGQLVLPAGLRPTRPPL